MLINEETEAKRIERLVVKAYLDILGRVPEDKGKMEYVNALLQGHYNVSQMMSNLLVSEEYKINKSLIATGKIGKDVAYIDQYTGRIVWKIAADSEEIEKNISKSWDSSDIVFVSTWNIKCGIATYTGYLLNAINKVYKMGRIDGTGMGGAVAGLKEKEICSVYSINDGVTWDKINGRIVHLQHEFGIIKKIPESNSKVIVTFHSIPVDIDETIRAIEKKLSVVGYVAHFEESAGRIKGCTKNDVYLIPHGTKRIAGVGLKDIKGIARDLLNFDRLRIGSNEDVAFIFGFQGLNKNIGRLIESCKNVGIKVIVSGSVHNCGYKSGINEKEAVRKDIESGRVIFIGRFLDDAEIDLYALASDILLFDYIPQDHLSCSGALHRVIGAGKPVVCSRTMHFLDVRENIDGVLKFGNRGELENKIREGLNRRDELGKNALDYAERTSWDKVAQMHLSMYRKYVDI